MDLQRWIEAASAAADESAELDFKDRFDPKAGRDWCEVVKDLVALANSGGGCLVFGVKNDGSPACWDPRPVLDLDPAVVTDKVAKYTGVQFAGFVVAPAERGGSRVALIAVEAARVPLVFTSPGTYQVEGSRQETAFARGSVYFRHGAKSEPGTTEDLRNFLDRALREEREHLLSNVRRVFEAPLGHKVVLVPADAVTSGKDASGAMRLTSDPTAPAYRPSNPDDIYPHRQKEVVAAVNARLDGELKISGHDVQCVRKAHGIDESRAEFMQKRRFETARYSEQFVDWLIAQHRADAEFFAKARAACRPAPS